MYKILLFTLLLFSACNFKKATTVTVTNNNNYPMGVTINANNINHTITVGAKAKNESLMYWTDINKQDGSYLLYINHQGSIDTFSHGAFTGGELSNYMDLVIDNHEVKINVSE